MTLEKTPGKAAEPTRGEIAAEAAAELMREEMAASEAAAQVAYWGVLLADREAAAGALTDKLKIWRGRMIESILASDPKLAEWKATAALEAMPEYAQLREKRREVEREVGEAKALFEAYQRRFALLEKLESRKPLTDAAAAATTRGRRK